MAEAKRSSAAGKIAIPKTGGPPAQDSLESLSSSIGSRIKVTTTAPHSQTLEGTLFTACSILNVLAINTTPAPPNPSSTTANQPGDYHIIPLSKIQSFTIISLAETTDGFTNAIPQITKVDTKKLKAREETRIRKLQEEERKRGKGVSAEAQSLYNFLDKMYPATRWHNTDIVVSDAVIISDPYTADSCRAPKEKHLALAQIKKVVEGGRWRTAASGTSTPVPPRKGG